MKSPAFLPRRQRGYILALNIAVLAVMLVGATYMGQRLHLALRLARMEEQRVTTELAMQLDALIDSRLADVKNTGGRPAGSITAAQFLQRFIRDGQPWVHIDIAGVALPPGATDLAPKGATGWGVMTLNRMIRDQFEG